jgi:hypothetical protein
MYEVMNVLLSLRCKMRQTSKTPGRSVLRSNVAMSCPVARGFDASCTPGMEVAVHVYGVYQSQIRVTAMQ